MQTNRYTISLLPDPLCSNTLVAVAMNMCEGLTQGHVIGPDAPPHVPLVEFTAPTNQAAHTLFNNWATRDRPVMVTPNDLGYGRVTSDETDGGVISNARLLVFCEPTDELISLQEAFEVMAKKKPFKLILPDDDDDFPALKITELRAGVFGQISVRAAVKDAIMRTQPMTPVLARCDELGHIVHILAPGKPFGLQ